MRKILIICVALSVYFLKAESSDFQIWIKHHMATHLDHNWRLRWRGETRWERNAGRLFQLYQQAGLQRKIADSWWVTAWYRQDIRRQEDETFQNRYIAIIDLDGKIDDGIFTIDRRSRLEFDPANDTWFFRDRTRIWLPWKLYRESVRPFVSNEFFLERFNEFVDNRLVAGLAARLPGQAEMRAGYMLRTHKLRDKWILVNALVIRAFLEF